jgi:hypothetical protein
MEEERYDEWKYGSGSIDDDMLYEDDISSLGEGYGSGYGLLNGDGFGFGYGDYTKSGMSRISSVDFSNINSVYN